MTLHFGVVFANFLDFLSHLLLEIIDLKKIIYGCQVDEKIVFCLRLASGSGAQHQNLN